MERFELSAAEKLQQLDNLGPLGDLKPSQLLRHMQRLSDNQVETNAVLENQFFLKLPLNISHILKERADLSLAQKAQVADRMMAHELARLQMLGFSVTTPADKIDPFSEDQINAIKQIVQNNGGNRPSGRYINGGQKNQSDIKPRNSRDSDWCWFHTTFGARATKCSRPCSFPKNDRGFQ